MIERAGYVIFKADAWRGHERQLTEALSVQAEAQAIAARASTLAASNALLEQQLSEYKSQLTSFADQLGRCQSKLAECAKERHSLSLRIGRAEANARSADRERARLQSELEVCRDQLARADTAGRIGEVEAENRRLRQRIADLETYLKETRGPDRNFYL